MKAKGTIPKKGQLPDPPLNIQARRAVPAEGKLPDPPLNIQDTPNVLPEITHAEMVEFANAFYVFRLARADFEAKRAALTMKLLRGCRCEESDYFASLDEHSSLIIEGHTSLDVVTRRLIIDRESVPSGGAA